MDYYRDYTSRIIYIYIIYIYTWTFNWYLNFRYEIFGLQVPEKIRTQKKRSNQDLKPCGPVESDPFFVFRARLWIFALVLWIFALEFAVKKRSDFSCLIVQPANVQKMREFDISARICNLGTKPEKVYQTGGEA